MSTLVDRLRAVDSKETWARRGGLMEQAADEIKRLESECDKLQAQLAKQQKKMGALRAIVSKLPKDGDGDPIEDGKSYFFRCANGALEFVAYFGPRNRSDGILSYPWHEAHKTREAAEKARGTT